MGDRVTLALSPFFVILLSHFQHILRRMIRANNSYRSVGVAFFCLLLAFSLLYGQLAVAGEARQLHPAELRAHKLMQSQPPQWQSARAEFLKAAEAGSPMAMAHLGRIHEEGLGVEPSESLAVTWYSRAVAAGADHLALKLGWLHLLGGEPVRDRERAEAWFQQAIDNGDLDAHVALASVLIAEVRQGGPSGRLDEALSLLNRAQEGSHPVANFFLAGLYLEGVGEIAPDYELARHYAEIGADQGHPQMQGWLATIYHEGLGVEADPVTAAMWAILAAVAGDPEGQQLRDSLEAELSDQDMALALQRARDWAE